MLVHVFSVMKDEEDLLPYFLRYYEIFADKIYILNDQSTDKTVEIAKSHPKVQILDIDLEGKFDEHKLNRIFEDSYKKYSRGVADWVIIADADEIIYHPEIVKVLTNMKRDGHTVLKTTGYDIYAKQFVPPEGQIYEDYQMGLRNTLFDKAVVFDPSIDIEFVQGRHTTDHMKPKLPESISYIRCELLMLHFKYLSQYFAIKSLLKSDHGMDKEKWAWKIHKNLNRWEQGLKGELGELLKVI